MASRNTTGYGKDQAAAAVLAELRIERGLSREEVPHAMRMAGIDARYVPSGRTLWRIETTGAVPCERFRFGLAQFYGRTVSGIWASTGVRVAA